MVQPNGGGKGENDERPMKSAFDLVLDGRPIGEVTDAYSDNSLVVRVTHFGEDGPWATWQGSELVHQALAGIMALCGYDDPEWPPVMAAGRQAEIVGGLMAAIAALMLVNGAGERAATSWHEALSVNHEQEFTSWTVRGERLRRHTGQAASWHEHPPRHLWQTADGRYIHTLIPALTTTRFATLVAWLDSHGMAADLHDEKYRSGRARLAAEPHIWEVLGAFIGTQSAEDVFRGAQVRDLTWGVARDAAEAAADPAIAGRPVVAPAGTAGAGLPWRLHQGPPSARRPRPHGELRVLDFTWQAIGPTITRILAHGGADVVRLERPGKPELMRVLPIGSSQPFSQPEDSPFFVNLNAGKRSIALDMTTDRETIEELIATADIVVENFSSRVMERWGLGFDGLQKLNPAIVYVSVCGYGHEGPKRDYGTYGPTAAAESGMTALVRDPAKESPAGFGYSYLDYIGGYFGALGALSALAATRADGRPRWVDMSQVECGVVCTSFAREAGESLRLGNDGPVVEVGDGRWIVGLDPTADGGDVPADAYAAVAAVQAQGVAAGIVQDVADRVEFDPQLAHLGTYPVIDGFTYEATPIRIDGQILPIRRPGPVLGAHTVEVLRDWLGR